MSHLEPDRLVLRALGEEPLDDGETGHLAGCESCRAEIAELWTVAGIGRETHEVRDLPAPPEHVWHMINADVGTAETPRRRELHKRREPTWRKTALIAAAAALIAVVFTLFVVRREPVPQAVCTGATIRLTALPDASSGASATACLATEAGEHKLRVSASGLPAPADGFYEVWLIDPSSLSTPLSVRMVAVGTLGTTSGADFTLPPTVDPGRYRVVDISAEPNDGNAAHSGHSLLRGEL